MDFVKVRNKGETPFTFRHNKSVFAVNPGGEEIVPWEGVHSLLGDPRLRNTPKNRERHDTFRRKRAMLNFLEGFMSEEMWEQGWVDENGTHPPMKPQLEVYTMDGTRIYMVLDDPDGVMENPAIEPSAEGNTDAKVAQLERKIDELMNMLSARQMPEADQSIPEVSEAPESYELPEPVKGSGATRDGGSSTLVSA